MAFHHPKDAHKRAVKYWRNKSSLRRLFRAILPTLRAIAKRHGYALAAHGSMKRDFDLMAIPWVEDARPAEELVEAIKEEIGGRTDPQDPTMKPHGRRVWCIHLSCGGKFSGYLDLGFMPIIPANGK